MKILVFAYDLVVSGVTVNAIELAAAVRDLHGHEVVLFAGPGPLVKLVEDKRLRFIPAPPAHQRIHPSFARMRALRDVIRRERPDLIHVWEWPQCLDTYYLEYLLMRIPIIVTDMSMHVQRILPKDVPTTFGIPELLDEAKALGRKQLGLLLPPVDVSLNSPEAVNPESFRKRYGLTENDITLVTVSRLAKHMKSDSLFRTLDAVSILGSELPLRLVIVGDGDVKEDLERLAETINTKLGRPAVVLTGALVDPRPAYAAADIVIGMGGSALRGMAFGKPVIIVGEQGYAEAFTPETADTFLYKGIYGMGDGGTDNSRFVSAIRTVAEHPDNFQELGGFSRQFILNHFSLEVVSKKFVEFCHVAVARQPRFHVAAADGLRTAAVWARERRFMPLN
jgi:L-malate glycosyltransferase